MIIRNWLPLITFTALAACTVGPDHHRPEVAFAPEWQTPADTAAVDVQWWQVFNDANLSGLIEAGLEKNFDLKEAEARLREARAQRDAAAGRALPHVSAVGSASETRLSENGQLPLSRIPGIDPSFALYDLGFDASWELDLWGATERAVEAAEARAQARDEARHGIMLQLVSEIARTYVDLRGAQARLISTKDDAEAQQSIARLVKERFEAGEASRFDLARAEGQALATQAQLAQIEADARAAIYRLALLTGRPPEALVQNLSSPASLPAPPAAITAGFRSDILRRRPDIRQAERELAAFTAEVGVATAELFPRLSLVGAVGLQSRSASDLSESSSLRYQVGPSLRWPIFSGGRIRAEIRAANARAEAAAARYERSVLTALSDSETALNRHLAAQLTTRQRREARDQARLALDLARQRYRAGEDDLIVLLDAQSAYSVAERQSIDAHVAELAAVVALYKSLGGGWEAAESQQ